MITHYVENNRGIEYNGAQEVTIEYFMQHIPDIKWLKEHLKDNKEAFFAIMHAGSKLTYYNRFYKHVDTYAEDGVWRVQICYYMCYKDIKGPDDFYNALVLMKNANDTDWANSKSFSGAYRTFTVYDIPFVD